MLHIFWLHSHITFLIAKEVIDKIALNEDVLVFLSRGYTVPINFERENVKLVSFPWYREISSSPHNLLVKTNINRTRRNVKKCKSLLDYYINRRRFLLYGPTSWEYTVGLLLKHKLCEGYYYIEEGTLSYLPKGNKLQQNWFYKLVAKYLFNLPYMSMLEELSHFLGVYASSSETFPWNVKEKNVVEIRPVFNYYPNFNDLEQIVIFDDLTISNSSLTDLADSLCDYFRENKIEKFGYKFHPITKVKPEKENIIRERLRLFESYELPSDFVVELFLIGKSVTIYSVNSSSSLLIYAKRFGSEAITVTQGDEGIVMTPFKSLQELNEI